MATRGLERGSLERYPVERADVLSATDGVIELATVARRRPWPAGPFPPEPDDAGRREGRLRIEVVGDAAVRVRYAPDGLIRDGGSHMVVGEIAPPARVEVTREPGRVELRKPKLSLSVNLDPYGIAITSADDSRAVRIGGPDPNYFAVADSLGTGVHDDLVDGRPVATETFGLAPSTAVYGFGETFLGLDKNGQVLDLWVSDALGVHTPRVYKAVPFFVTTGGCGVFVHSTARVTAWVGSRSAHEVQIAVDDDVLDYYVFVGTIREVLGAYTRLTGRPALPPPWSFGWWQSKCSYVSAEQTLAVVRGMREAGIPMDVIHLDTYWFRTDWKCDLEFAPDRFPDPEAYCRELAEQGVHLSLWQMPYLVEGSRLHDRLAEVGGFVRDAGGDFYDVGIHFVQGYDGPVHAIDWTNPDAVDVMEDEYARLLRTGASVLKVDFGESLPADAVFADGTPGERMHNLYPLRYGQVVHEVTERVRGEGIAWSRSGWAGSQRYPVHWGGDAPASWDMMLPQLQGGVSLGLSGFTFWSADIAGTNDLPKDEELLIRWLQWGVLLSHPRVHGMGDREPFRWTGDAGRVARDWIRLRYALMPYLLATARSSAADGLPFARALALEFQDDPTTWRIGDQFLCGPSILVAPLLEPGGRRRVYLPEGAWIDWWTRARVAGPRWITAEHDLDTAPLFLREGSLVPTGPVMPWVGQRPTDPLRVVVGPFEGDGQTEVAWPDRDGDVSIRYVATEDRHVVEVEGAPGAVELDVTGNVHVELRST